jgi:hypothetical protein
MVNGIVATSRVAAGIALVALLGCISTASGRKDDSKMNEHISLYGWARGGASITLAGIEHVATHPAAAAQEAMVLDVRIEHVLFGPRPGPTRRYELVRPTSDVARLKFPDPVWARVTIQPGAKMLLVLPGAEGAADPVYVESAPNDDPVLRAIRSVLDTERADHSAHERFARYVHWVSGGTPVERLFGAEALARDPLREVDPRGEAARALAGRFTSDVSLYVRLSVGVWMWDVLPKSNAAGKIAVLEATLHGVTDHSEDIRRFCTERLVVAEDALVKLPGITAPPGALPALQQQHDHDSDPQTRAGLQRWIDALRGTHGAGPVK